MTLLATLLHILAGGLVVVLLARPDPRPTWWLRMLHSAPRG